MIERLGPARFISMLDLTRGYSQIPLTPRAKEEISFVTLDDLFQYRVLPFKVHGEPATFQRLMNHVLRPHQEYAAMTLWSIVKTGRPIARLEAVLGALREAGLMPNAAKCHVGVGIAPLHDLTQKRQPPPSTPCDGPYAVNLSWRPQPSTRSSYYRLMPPQRG